MDFIDFASEFLADDKTNKGEKLMSGRPLYITHFQLIRFDDPGIRKITLRSCLNPKTYTT